jgi:hypothetical protein
MTPARGVKAGGRHEVCGNLALVGGDLEICDLLSFDKPGLPAQGPAGKRRTASAVIGDFP